MSGINSLLDTLLHQVLGKRVDVPIARSLVSPLAQVAPSEAPRSVQADAWLEGRLPVVPADFGARAIAGRTGAEHQQPSHPPAGTASVDVAGVTQFSATARLIAQVLSRYPSPPPPLRPPVPLCHQGATPKAPELAASLQRAIAASGLFYESHLAGWYRGAIGREQLMAEPQMRYTEGQQDATLAPALQGLVRQQLELLAVPTLRWETEIWPDMVVAIELSPEEKRHEGDSDDSGGQETWHSELHVKLEHLGAVTARVHLAAQHLGVTLEVGSRDAYRRAKAGGDWLIARLAAQSFTGASVRVVLREENNDQR